ncbi:MAG: carboxypeptidase-like regulatory domain-containing protein, partial [Blastocatellia bacterium]
MICETGGKRLVRFGILLALLVSVLHSSSLHAQVVGGTISGTVADSSGAVVANATVSLKNLATGVSTTTTTNAQGIYSAPNLLPGNYEARVSMTGFETSVQTGITLSVGSQLVLNVTMKV